MSVKPSEAATTGVPPPSRQLANTWPTARVVRGPGGRSPGDGEGSDCGYAGDGEGSDFGFGYAGDGEGSDCGYAGDAGDFVTASGAGSLGHATGLDLTVSWSSYHPSGPCPGGRRVRSWSGPRPRHPPWGLGAAHRVCTVPERLAASFSFVHRFPLQVAYQRPRPLRLSPWPQPWPRTACD